MILSQDKNIKLVIHGLTFLSFLAFFLFGNTLFFVPLILYFVFKSQSIKEMNLESALFQFGVWLAVFLWNFIVIRTIMISLLHIDLSRNSLFVIFGTIPLYIILLAAVILGPLKGILYELQNKEFHYPIVSRWVYRTK
ncbi:MULTISPECIES: DUF4870 domain-containing protein [Bacillus]|uniref:DUF4870 domain-containing protein n=2 Tax=Bacillus cereus group TaxID=86661 RepID=A0A2C1DX55_BACCE|nr:MULTISPECIES: DUF4870 domain-containing protein [Bacillus cereus group]OFD78517.1 hypothetical protein BWGOE9_26560 [Bacillus mycoides]OFD78916.1 hypothetical protein BWGOE8_26320 [Bacillus mycoides]OFD79776.1 hypothetical protein BWGOE10_30100 [Bacillus mycoides]PGT04240.1 hypothetical protein COD09_08020 [Bacillus cereus]